jgi:hypothetical protein
MPNSNSIGNGYHVNSRRKHSSITSPVNTNTPSLSRMPTMHQMSIQEGGETNTDKNTRILSTQDEVDEYAKSVGVKITFTSLGPGYRAVARAYHDPEQILGYCEGFVRPGEFSSSVRYVIIFINDIV